MPFLIELFGCLFIAFLIIAWQITLAEALLKDNEDKKPAIAEKL
jgi:hypothetical protein